jgi:hypothetical protein
MKKSALMLSVFSAIIALAGCHSDIVCTAQLKQLTRKCVYIEPLKTESPAVGIVLRDIIEKEFVRRQFEICDANSATIIIGGSAFLTQRSEESRTFLGGSANSSQAIESVSLVAKNRNGELLASASYDNNERYTADKLGREFGGALADKLK